MKKALLIGCTYNGTDSKLNGTLNDVIRMNNCLIEKYGYKNEEIKMLIEHEGYEEPTGKNIIDAIVQLLIESLYYGCKEVYIHFSGHGTQVWDLDGDESDGLDECWVPIDYKKNGVITDDLLNKYFKWFPKGCKVTCVVDACHSSTCLDLKYIVDTETGDSINSNENCKCDHDNITLISGCRAYQTSLDVVKEGSWGGALTYAILENIEKNDNIVLFDLVNNCREYMKKNRYPQVPQLCSARKINNTDKFIKNI